MIFSLTSMKNLKVLKLWILKMGLKLLSKLLKVSLSLSNTLIFTLNLILNVSSSVTFQNLFDSYRYKVKEKDSFK